MALTLYDDNNYVSTDEERESAIASHEIIHHGGSSTPPEDKEINSNYTVLQSDFFLVATNTINIVLTLPNFTNFKNLVIKTTGSKKVTINANWIDGDTSIIVRKTNASLSLMYSNSKWYIVGSYNL